MNTQFFETLPEMLETFKTKLYDDTLTLQVTGGKSHTFLSGMDLLNFIEKNHDIWNESFTLTTLTS